MESGKIWPKTALLPRRPTRCRKTFKMSEIIFICCVASCKLQRTTVSACATNNEFQYDFRRVSVSAVKCTINLKIFSLSAMPFGQTVCMYVCIYIYIYLSIYRGDPTWWVPFIQKFHFPQIYSKNGQKTQICGFFLSAFFCLSFSSLPLLFDILKPKRYPPGGLSGIYTYTYTYTYIYMYELP